MVVCGDRRLAGIVARLERETMDLRTASEVDAVAFESMRVALEETVNDVKAQGEAGLAKVQSELLTVTGQLADSVAQRAQAQQQHKTTFSAMCQQIKILQSEADANQAGQYAQIVELQENLAELHTEVC